MGWISSRVGMRMTDALEGFLVQRQPIRHGAAGGGFQVPGGQLAGDVGVLDFDHVVHLQGVGGDVDLAAVDA